MNQSRLWEPAMRIERAFTRALRKVAKAIIRFLKRFFSFGNNHQEEETPEGKAPAYTASSTIINAIRSGDVVRALKAFSETKEFRDFARAASMKMVTGLFRDVGHSWRQAAAANGQGRLLYETLMQELKVRNNGQRGAYLEQLVQDNTYRIVTLPADIGHDVAAYVEREALKGRRASDIAQEIQKKFPEHTTARANLIARTQVSMTQTNLIRTRAESLGLNWYVWRAVGGGKGDGRTRHSHRGMSGVLVSWNDPPAPEDLFPRYTKSGRPYRNTLGHYHAGQCPNCRCYPETVVDIDLVTFPARVYWGGRIFSVNRKQFEQMMR